MAQQITIQAIEQKEFRTKARGYDPEEVDTFLDDICDEMERQQNTIASLQQQVREAQNAAQRNPQSTLRPSGADTAELNRLQGMVKSIQQQLNESQPSFYCSFRTSLQQHGSLRADAFLPALETEALRGGCFDADTVLGQFK